MAALVTGGGLAILQRSKREENVMSRLGSSFRRAVDVVQEAIGVFDAAVASAQAVRVHTKPDARTLRVLGIMPERFPDRF